MPTFKHELKTIDSIVDFGALPDEAKRELIEFYEFLVFKYQRKQAHGDTFTTPSVQSPQTLSKWAKIAQRVQNEPVHLAGYAEQLKSDLKEFRNNFEFRHDK